VRLTLSRGDALAPHPRPLLQPRRSGRQAVLSTDAESRRDETAHLCALASRFPGRRKRRRAGVRCRLAGLSSTVARRTATTAGTMQPVRGQRRRGGVRRLAGPCSRRPRKRYGHSGTDLRQAHARNGSRLLRWATVVAGSTDTQVRLEAGLVDRHKDDWRRGRRPGLESWLTMDCGWGVENPAQYVLQRARIESEGLALEHSG